MEVFYSNIDALRIRALTQQYGSVYGIVGALAWILILNKGRYEDLTGKRMIIMVILSLYYGLSTGNVDNWGHIGGFIIGFIISTIFYRINKKEIDFSR